MKNQAHGDLLLHEFVADAQSSTGKVNHIDHEIIFESDDYRQLLQLKTELSAWKNSAAQFLSLDVFYPAEHNAMLVLQFFAHGETEPRMRIRLGIFPRLWTRVTLPLRVLDGQTLYLPRTPGRLKGMCEGSRVQRDEISHFALSLDDVGEPQVMHIKNVALLSDEPQYLLPTEPIVDELGQWMQKEWPGKTRSKDELREKSQAVLTEFREACWPQSWGRFGGSQSLQFNATGFFRVEYSDNRWWMVDPEGHAFWSAGMDCVRPMSDAAVVPGNEPLFSSLLPEERFAVAHGQTQKSVKRERMAALNFPKANLIRVFGESWQEKWEQITQGQLRQWRFNTIANWSDLEFAQRAKIPYVVQCPEFPSTRVTLFRDFSDVFDTEYEESARQCAQWLEQFRDDPYLIGYFLTNEPHWAFGAHNIASEMLEQNPGTHSRRALAQWLAEKYDSAQALSSAWEYSIDDFGALETQTFHRMAQRSETAHSDLWEFSKIMVRRSIQTVSRAAREVDSQHMNLGVRYAWVSSDLCYEGGDCYDVFSINCYSMLPPGEPAAQVMQRLNKPMLIGEFHFGAVDRGLAASGLRRVTTQEERGVAYRRFVEAAAADPNIVGVHYFQWNDQAVLGRFDGENCNIGFIDVCQQPHREIADAATQTHGRLYDVRLGKEKPFSQEARERPKIF